MRFILARYRPVYGYCNEAEKQQIMKAIGARTGHAWTAEEMTEDEAAKLGSSIAGFIGITRTRSIADAIYRKQ